MAGRVRVQLNASELAKTMNSSGGQFQRYLENKAKELAAEAKANMPHSAGDLASSVRVENTSGVDTGAGRPNATGIIRGKRVIVEAAHADFVERGTGPAHETAEGSPAPKPGYMPGQSQALEDWAMRERPELVRVNKNGTLNLWLLREHIRQKGTPARHYMLRALKRVFPNARGRFTKFGSER